MVPTRELVGQLVHFLEATARFARQLPSDHFDDLIPGHEAIKVGILPDGTPLRLPDGTPFIQHHTYFGLLTHILAHAGKFLHIAQNPTTDLFNEMSVYYPFGEPRAGATLDAVTAQLGMTLEDIKSWWERRGDSDMSAVHVRNSAPITFYEQLCATTYATAQHARQLEEVLRMVGVEPNGRLLNDDFRELDMPTSIWG